MCIFVAMKGNTILQDIIVSGNQSHADIARKLQVSPQLLNWMIKNPKRLRVDQIESIATVLRRSPRNLFSLIINN